MRSLLMVPGYTGSGPRHWQTLWEQKLSSARRVEMPDWDHPDRDAWVEALDRAVAGGAEPPVLVAHSCGVSTVVHWAAQGARPVRAALLVAPADTGSRSYPSDALTFHPLPEVELPFPSIVVASSNDPYCALERAEALARAWGSRLVNLGACGHINVDAGFGPWPEGERLLAALAGEPL
ncbi:RBBP9/YdeN family alpha/beta hydrolase [Sorangium sp. So ce131]|uniref:RBBP9/YdeN family alpha/beta hydrolase n=1 Tax=Sorangium sp. So ce131 TaxID=3133282 RepID=UPI003F5FF7B1